MVFIGATSDRRFRAFDAKSGKELWVTKLESNRPRHAVDHTAAGENGRSNLLLLPSGPGGNFGDGSSATTALAAYTLFPKGQVSPADAKLQSELKAMQISNGGVGSEPQDIHPPLSAPLQPIAFSHKLHMTTVGMKCDDCHQMSSDGKQMQIANVATCMTCHQSVMTTSPEIQKLARLEKEARNSLGSALYAIAARLSFFSHQKHMDAKSKLRLVCHGAVDSKDTLGHAEEPFPWPRASTVISSARSPLHAVSATMLGTENDDGESTNGL